MINLLQAGEVDEVEGPPNSLTARPRDAIANFGNFGRAWPVA